MMGVRSESTTGRGIRGAVALVVFAGAMVAPPIAPQEPAAPAAQPSTATAKTPLPASAYAGDAVCATCHDERAKTFFATPHYLDSSLASKKTILGNFTPGKNVLRTPNPDLIFAMIAADDGFFESAVNIRDPQNLTGRAEKFDVVVGSGRHGQTYLYWKGDELFELPVSYWTWTQAWINSPGYPDGGVRFNRPIEPRCLECHISWFKSLAPPDNRYDRDSMVLPIGCERCHGPGREHVERERGANPPAAGSPEIAIVNPARLPRDRQMGLCSLCHSGPAETIGLTMTYLPGDEITDYLKITAPPANVPVDVHGNQVGALESSKCFTSGKLTCSTCHDVHRTQENADAFSRHCLSCHDVHACGRFKQMGEAIRGKCIECHMPVGKSMVLTSQSSGQLLQAQLRTHRIAIYPQAGMKQ
jgi:hypothetical protein